MDLFGRFWVCGGYVRVQWWAVRQYGTSFEGGNSAGTAEMRHAMMLEF